MPLLSAEGKLLVRNIIFLGLAFSSVIAHFFTSPSIQKVFRQNLTPFSANKVLLLFYFLAQMLSFAGMSAPLYFVQGEADEVVMAANKSILFISIFIFGWTFAWTGRSMVWSALLSLFMFSQASRMYFRNVRMHKGPVFYTTVKLPSKMFFAFSIWLLVYTMSAFFDCKSLPCRVFSNVMIWFIAGAYLVPIFAFYDATLAFLSSYIFFSMGVGQVMISLFTLQYVFAFLLSIILAVVGVGALFMPKRTPASPAGDVEQAPLLNDSA
ncbi:fungal protein [Schizosaccharomyces japonicus yFS275]|uniref:Fungal protein n=1 Tax=Schizosaccharomyces japonicus (strain yFS275 / FY16936) TaxID=402676 RepID=B6JXJ6_SCHJY|nr:fungal protein [Schizosaccharomyces japonicus yFS275]EEB05140.1 fungal protein [Schizosaccharomyces japonicus yFS275]